MRARLGVLAGREILPRWPPVRSHVPGCFLNESIKVKKMRVFIAGGSGLIGRQLARTLLQKGHQPVILSRRADQVRRDPEMWAYQVVPGDPTSPGRWQDEVDGCHAVVNLARHNVFAERWNPAVKAKIRDSRVYGAENLVAAIKQASARPQVFVHGSAIGYYGVHGDEELTEASPSGTDFLAVVSREAKEVSHHLDELGVARRGPDRSGPGTERGA